MLANRIEGSANYPLFNKDRSRLSGREAWTNNLELAALVASKIASCLGPTGSYKLVAYHRGPELVTKVTKDAVDMVDELGVQYPAIKTLAQAAKIHRDEAGDGVSVLLVLVSSFLEQAQRLVEQGIHRVAIVDGYRESAKQGIDIIDELAFQFEGDLEDALLQIVDGGRGLLNARFRKELSEAVQLAEDHGEIDLSRITIEKKLGGAIEESRLVHGVVIKKEKKHRSMPEILEQPKIAMVYKSLELRPPEKLAIGEGPFPTILKVTEPGQLHDYKKKESAMRTAIVEKVKATGANVLICSQKIDEKVADRLSREGIFALEMFTKPAIDEISRVTGARIAGSVDLLTRDDIGEARKLEVDKIPPEKVTILHCDRAATLLLRGGSIELVQELEKIVRRALLVLKHARARSKVVPGGGGLFMELALRLRASSLSFPSRQQLAVRAFGDALESIPRWLAFNMGFDPIDTITQLRSQHSNGLSRMGVSQLGCADMSVMGVVELASIVKTTLWRSLEIAALLLKIDDYFFVKDRAFFHK